MSRRLLILACSARKAHTDGALPAYDRYTGPLWGVLRNYIQRQPLLATDLDAYALSARFGLIPASQQIPWYDETMTPARIAQIRPNVLTTFRTLLLRGYDTLCLGLSQPYLRALEGWNRDLPANLSVTITDGTMGTKLRQLRLWLEGGSAMSPTSIHGQRLDQASVKLRTEVVIGGQRLCVTCEQIMAQARAALTAEARGAENYRDWYVMIDDQRVAPKWLISLLTGLPPSRFDAGAARRALTALGIMVKRVEQS
jgi:hypothetical protein